MVQRTVLKVDISCKKCKRQLLKAVSRLQGIDKIEVDATKNTLTVIGNADPFEVIVCTRKIGKLVEVVSIGPLPVPPKQDAGGGQKTAEEKKPDQKKDRSPAPIFVPVICPICEQMALRGHQQEPFVACSIL